VMRRAPGPRRVAGARGASREVGVSGKSFRPQPAEPGQNLAKRAPVAANRSAPRRSQASHRPLQSVQPPKPLQLELFGNRRPAPPAPAQPERRFPQLAPAAGAAPSAPAPAVSWGAAAQPESVRSQLFRRLSRLTAGRLRSLSLTDNRRTILSVRPVAGGRGPAQAQGARAPIDLRIHHSFAGASEPVLRAVATFLDSTKGSGAARHALAAIREHFHRHRLQLLHTIQPLHPSHPSLGPPPGTAKPRRLAIDPVGNLIDLREIAGDLNQRYFGGRLKVRITWGKATGETAHNCRRSRTASLQLGSYSYEDRLIRIHRVLDRQDVPRFVIESVVYHELLHADLPLVTHNGRRYFHTPEFRRRESEFRHHEKADVWVRENLQHLLRARGDARTAAARRRGART
jgi:hypothetical protein